MANTTVKGKFNIVAENGNVQTIYPKTTGDQVLVDRSSNASVIPNDVANLQHIINKMGALALKSKVETSDFTTGTMISSLEDLKSNTDTGKIADATVVKNIESRVDTLENSNLVTVDELDAGLATKPDTEINDAVTSTSLTWSSKKLSDQLTELNSNTSLLTNRVNTIIALPDGATTNDARLEDICVGYDDTEYDSPGESVRTQISDLHMNIQTKDSQHMLFLEDIESANVFNSIEKDVYYNKILTGYNTTTFDKIINSPINGIGDNCVLYDFNISDIPEKYNYMYVYTPTDLNEPNYIIFYTVGVRAFNYNYINSNANIVTINNKRYLEFNLAFKSTYERCIIAFKIGGVSVIFKEHSIANDELHENNIKNKYIDINANTDINDFNIDYVNLDWIVSVAVLNANPSYKYYISGAFNNHVTSFARRLEIFCYNIETGISQRIAAYSHANTDNTPPTDIEHIVLNGLYGRKEIFDLYINWSKGNNSFRNKYAINDKYYQYLETDLDNLRIAYDEREYSTPGIAIRTQISDIYKKYKYYCIDTESMSVFEFIEKDVYYNKILAGYNTTTFDKIINSPINGIGDNCVLYDFNISDIPEKYNYMYMYAPTDLNEPNYIIFYTVGVRASNYNYINSNANIVTIDNRRFLKFNLSYFRNYEKCIIGFKKDEVLVLFKENEITNTNIYNHECIMPSKMVCISNNEYNIYYNTLFRFIDTNNLIHPSVSNNKFIPYKKFVKYTPTTETSDFSVYFNFRMNNTQVVDYSSKTMTIKTIPKNSGNGLTKKVLIIGDSLTDADVSSRELKTLFTNDVMNIEFIGTRGGNTNEGYSGWRAFTFVCCDNQNKEDFNNSTFTQQSVPNPFYNSSIEGLDDGTSRKFDFEYYMTTQGYSGVDYVIICLGTNDIARGNHKGDEMKELWDFMINSIKSYNPNVKIGLWLPPTRAMCDNAFKSGIDGSLVANKWIIENYDNREDENIFLIPAQFVVDPENDYNITETSVNPRTPSVTVRTVVDTIHPKQSGYLKIADLMYGYIKYFGYLDSQE